jgi:hypothetical protein
MLFDALDGWHKDKHPEVLKDMIESGWIDPMPHGENYLPTRDGLKRAMTFYGGNIMMALLHSKFRQVLMPIFNQMVFRPVQVSTSTRVLPPDVKQWMLDSGVCGYAANIDGLLFVLEEDVPLVKLKWA